MKLTQKKILNLKAQAEEIKQRIAQERKESYLKRFELYSQYFAIQLQLNPKYGIRKMAIDLDIDEGKLYVIMALKQATPFSLQMIKEGRIFPSKVARICHSTMRDVQEEIVKVTIAKNYTYDELEQVLVNNTSEVEEKREYKNNWNILRDIETYSRKFKIVLPSISRIPKDKKEEVKELLIDIRRYIDRAIKNL